MSCDFSQTHLVHECFTSQKNLHLFPSSASSMAALSSSVSATALLLCISNPHSTKKIPRKYSISISASSSSSHESQSATRTEILGVSAKGKGSSPELPYSYAPALPTPNGSPVVRFVQSTESVIEKVCGFYEVDFILLSKRRSSLNLGHNTTIPLVSWIIKSLSDPVFLCMIWI